MWKGQMFLLCSISSQNWHGAWYNGQTSGKIDQNQEQRPQFFIVGKFLYASNIILQQHLFMNQINLQEEFVNTLLQVQNPIIKLYITNKYLEQELTREIHINTCLKNYLNKDIAYNCKVEHIQNIWHKQSSTESKAPVKNLRGKKKNTIRKMKNDTKNIPKNFGKAIITFIEQNQQLVRKALNDEPVSYENFSLSLKDKKRGINSIADLRGLWLESQFPYAKQMRMLSHYFLKRGSLNYVFSSRITNHEGHIKYRGRLIQVLKNPQEFTSIKTN